MSDQPILRLKELTKQYPGVLALDHVSLDFMKGEIHALAGENGAGKSTLIKMVSGAISPTEGVIEIDGKTFTQLTPTESRANGISVIYQEFNLVGELTVYENIFLGEYLKKGIFLDKETMRAETRKLFEMLGIPLNPNQKINELSVAYQQMVEIAKAISKSAKVLIMDEPSAPLTTNEVEIMHRCVKKLNEQGVTIIYITHRLEEIFELADRVTVLRDGRLIDTTNVRDTNRDALICKMIGRELVDTYPAHTSSAREDVILKVDRLCGNGDENISLELHHGEILGIGGLVGSGRTEFAEMLFGVAHMEGGSVFKDGKPYHPSSPSDAIREGVVLVPEDRKRHGVLLNLSELWNITISSMNRLTRMTFIRRPEEKKVYKKYHDQMHIKTSSEKQEVRNLSGGNQQKVVLAKWMATQPDVIILDEPTRGIDVAAKYEIYQLMIDLVKSGKSIIMISSEMPELIGMSDRIAVFSRGKLSAILNKEEFSQEAILKFAI